MNNNFIDITWPYPVRYKPLDAVAFLFVIAVTVALAVDTIVSR